MPKFFNIVLTIDGTDMDIDQAKIKEQWGNVARLQRWVSVLDVTAQITHYEAGIGTRPDEFIPGSVAGVNLESRVIEAYRTAQRDCAHAFDKGLTPRLYIFGFSRGAFAARWLASLIDFCGIPPMKESEQLAIKAFRSHDVALAKSLSTQHGYKNVPIEMLGVWDTVQTTFTEDFGIQTLPACVNAAYHALAIDECRNAFSPTRFISDSRVTEVWFAGSHTDIGGGYSGRGLPETTLAWMCDRAREHGLLFVDHAPSESKPMSQKISYILHNSLTGPWKLLPHAARTIATTDLLHPSVPTMHEQLPGYAPTNLPAHPKIWHNRMPAQS
ncbi:MAG: DUF2235 domain-containing protein [Kiritimatiellia bacterium]